MLSYIRRQAQTDFEPTGDARLCRFDAANLTQKNGWFDTWSMLAKWLSCLKIQNERETGTRQLKEGKSRTLRGGWAQRISIEKDAIPMKSL